MIHEKNEHLFCRLNNGDTTARDELTVLNMEWIEHFLSKMVVRANIQGSEIRAAAKVGLVDAIDKFGNREHQFAPNDDLEGGYAIWWVRMRIAQFATSRGFAYCAATNCIELDTEKGQEE